MPLQSFTIRDRDNRKQRIIVIFEDEHILVINKPANLPVIPDHWNPALPNLRDIIESKYRKISPGQSLYVVHRIDAEKSGLMLFAKSSDMHQELNRLFETGKIKKTYLAIVSGRPPKRKGVIALPIAPHPSRKNFMQIHKDGKHSITEYRIIENFRHFSLLELHPKTGRTHQIRVHLKAINCPLAVDSVYGRSNSINISQIKTRYRPKRDEMTPSALIDRLTLHAFKVEFEDPIKQNARRQFEAAIPKDFLALVKAFRKYDQ